MDENKYVQKLLEISKKYDVDKIRNINYNEEYKSFEGSPKRHPTNDSILILIVNPFDANKHFYEFHLDTVTAVEELSTLSSDDNKSIYLIRVWVKKGTMAVKSETFIV